ncbi:MAG: 2-phospho-L-lactate transferase CofD family protein [Chloroflexia bacterium]
MTGVRFRGIESARPAREVVAALEAADLIVLCPSNLIVSIGPILATRACATRLRPPGRLSSP